VIRVITVLGTYILAICTSVGNFVIFLGKVLRALFSTHLRVSHVLHQIEHVGIGSLLIIVLTGLFTGMALALQTYLGFHTIGGESFIGPVIALAMTRELGPVLTGLMVTGRAGSAMAAELGTMQITEQIDALKTLCIDPFHYLIVPRILASMIILPFLSIFSMICGIAGGYMYCVSILGLNPEVYIAGIKQFGSITDIISGLIKSSFFGLILSWVGTYKGYTTTGGARGVGKATTQSVVISSIMILVANYFLSSLLSYVGIA
jgi:phospholipid/cholesterol/gamma-HCH transport system permease protein